MMHEWPFVERLSRILIEYLSGPAMWMAVLAAVLLVAANGVVVVVVVRLPATYFCDPPPRSRLRQSHRVLYWTLRIAKDVLGAMMITAGAVLTLPGVPGPGLVLMLLGFSLVDFPGKRRLVRNLVRRKSVHRSMNWIRARFGKPPLVIPERRKQRKRFVRRPDDREHTEPRRPALDSLERDGRAILDGSENHAAENRKQ